MSKWQIPAKGGNMEAANGIYYQNMTNKEVAERLKKNDVILIPVGSTENHGPSAPYGEDTYLDTRLCEQVAIATGCTVAQPIWYGSHPYHHLGQKGTIMIPEKILADYLAYVFAGFWNTGFRKIIVVNGHGQDYVKNGRFRALSYTATSGTQPKNSSTRKKMAVRTILRSFMPTKLNNPGRLHCSLNSASRKTPLKRALLRFSHLDTSTIPLNAA